MSYLVNYAIVYLHIGVLPVHISAFADADDPRRRYRDRDSLQLPTRESID